jgi:hypothetical protein
MTDKVPQKKPGGTAIGLALAAPVSAFLAQAAATAPPPGPRLLFALDATASREPSWALAGELQGAMLREAAAAGGLCLRIAYFRGVAEFAHSPWLNDPAALAAYARGVWCEAGFTQIGQILAHARAEARTGQLKGVIYVGDAMEEDGAALARSAGELGLLGVPLFLFQEGDDPLAEDTFRALARITRGAWFRFDAAAPGHLRALLAAVAVYCAGGRAALVRGGEGAALLLRHLGPG